MKNIPQSVSEFLAGEAIVVAGVSRSGSTPANAIFRRLRETGHEVIPVNPNASELEGRRCYKDIPSVPGSIHSVMIVTHPSISAEVARAALERGVKHIWFHRSFGSGSVAAEAVEECRDRGVEPIVGGCPLMYCPPVDPAHKFFCWWLRLRRRVPV